MTNESKTLYIPLYGRALMSKDGFFKDIMAEKIVASLSDELDYVDTSKKLAIYMSMRAMQFDDITLRYATEYPDLTVIHLGCGLDSRYQRIGATVVGWYDIDFADVIDLRKKYYNATERYHMISSSVTDSLWFEQISYNGGYVLVIAEGLSMYLSLNDMVNLINEIQSHFKNAFFVFDAYSTKAAKLSKFKNPINKVEAEIDFAMDRPEILEINSNVKCVFNNDIILKEYTEKLCSMYKQRFKFMGRFGSGFYRIYGYRIDAISR